MPTLALLNQSGEKIKDLELNDEIFGIEPNQQVLYDVVNQQRAAMRQGTHCTKTRTEVRGGGRKPWKQKGTGRARQGSIRAPQWRGGGIAFGPKPRDYSFKLNKKVRQLGMKSTLSYKVLNNKMIAIDSLQFDVIKTKNFIQFLNNIKVEGKAAVVVSKAELTNEVVLSSSNLPQVMVFPCDNVSVYELLSYDKLVVTQGALAYYEEALK